MATNPFAAFFLVKKETKGTEETKATKVTNSAATANNVVDLVSSPAPLLKKRPLHDDATTTTATHAKKLKHMQPSQHTTMETKRAQLNLINAYRLTHPASVDAFHSFLVSLPPGKQGHYWALIAALLSVQCRDVVALQVVKKVMRACPNGMDDVLSMTAETLLPLVNSCNFCNTKVKNIMTCTEQLQSLFQSQVPVKYKSLLKLRGVGPKIAHLMRSVAFGIDDTGIVVDTHVHKISAALNWTLKAKRPEALGCRGVPLSWPQNLRDVETIQHHHLVPCCNEVAHKACAAVGCAVGFGQCAQLRV